MALPTPDNLQQALHRYPEFGGLIRSLASYDRIKPRGILDLASVANKSGTSTGESIHEILGRNLSVSEWRNVDIHDSRRQRDAADSSLIFLEALNQSMGDDFINRRGSAGNLQFIAEAIRTLYSDLLLEDTDY